MIQTFTAKGRLLILLRIPTFNMTTFAEIIFIVKRWQVNQEVFLEFLATLFHIASEVEFPEYEAAGEGSVELVWFPLL